MPFVVAGFAAVLVAGRELPPSARPVVERAAAPRTTTASTAAVASEPFALGDHLPFVSAVPSAAVTPRPRRDEGPSAGGERWDSPSRDTDDWREQVVAAVGRQAVENALRNAEAVHTHLSFDGDADARAPSVMLAGAPSAAPAAAEEFFGWDGGKFWFGPAGLVRMKEAQP